MSLKTLVSLQTDLVLTSNKKYSDFAIGFTGKLLLFLSVRLLYKTISSFLKSQTLQEGKAVSFKSHHN